MASSSKGPAPVPDPGAPSSAPLAPGEPVAPGPPRAPQDSVPRAAGSGAGTASGFVVLGLCLLAVWLRLDVNAERLHVAHGDIGYYVSLARNLFEGRGFQIDYAPDFLSRPAGLPTPANTYWMPLPAVTAWLGMLGMNEPSYAAARMAFAALAGLVPLVGYLWGKRLFGSHLAGLFAAALGAVSAVSLTQGAQPQTHGLVLVLGSLALFRIVAWQDRGHGLWVIGPLIALACLNRSDGVLLFAAFAVAWWLRRRTAPERRPGWSAWVVVVGLYLVVMAPFYALNLEAFGRPTAVGLGRVAWLRSYPELYCLPETLTYQHFVDGGWERVLRTKARALGKLAAPLVLGPASLQIRFEGLALSASAWTALAVLWAGALGTLRRRFAAVWVYLLALVGLYGVVFSVTGATSFRSVSLALHPFLWAAGGFLVVKLARALFGRGGGPVAALLLLGLAVWSGTDSLTEARKRTREGVNFLEQSSELHARILSEIVEPAGLTDAVLLVTPEFIHELHADTGLALVSLPFEDAVGVHAVARRFGARHVLLIDGGAEETASYPKQRGAQVVDEHPDFRQLERKRIRGRRVRLFRITLRTDTDSAGFGPPVEHHELPRPGRGLPR